MVVEDSSGVRAYVTDLLEGHGYRVVAFSSPAEAVEQARSGTPFDIVLTDVVMPGMNGVEMVEKIREIRPDLKAVFMSGYPDRLQRLSSRIPAGSLVSKPFSPTTLLAAIRNALATN